MKSFLNKLNESINLVDIGCSDQLQTQWGSIQSKIRYIGFDPNKAECERLSELPTSFKETLFLPYAVAGFTGRTNLYITNSFYATSLLKPDYKWLNRFEFADFFKMKSIEEIDVMSLDAIEVLKDTDVDIIKIDSQGMELEILKPASAILKNAIYVETESGFHANYINESTQAEVDLFMRQNGFILFAILEKRMPLNNQFKDYARSNAQVLWCECKWLKDLITIEQNNEFEDLNISRSKALKYLLIFAVNGVYDYGLEYAKIFHKYKLIDDMELEELSDIENWKFENKTESSKKSTSKIKLLIRKIIRKNIQVSNAALNYFS